MQTPFALRQSITVQMIIVPYKPRRAQDALRPWCRRLAENPAELLPERSTEALTFQENIAVIVCSSKHFVILLVIEQAEKDNANLKHNLNICIEGQ